MAVHLPLVTLRVCGSCALRIADLGADPSEAFWARDVVAGTDSASAPVERAAARPTSLEGFDSERALEELKNAVAKQIPREDANSHLHLAEAYVEWGSASMHVARRR
jgi:hypothetical protein